MDNLSAKVVLAFTALLLCPFLCESQVQVDGINDNYGPYQMKWDAAQEKLIAYRNSTDPSAPSAQIYNNEGHSLPIYAVRDLAESHAFDVWDAVAMPGGGVTLVGLVEYGNANTHYPIKSVVVTYDGTGRLEKVWDVSPYEFDLVAVDGQGNIFAIGDANLEDPYFLMVKYSPEGKVIRQFLSTDQFPVGHEILSPGGGKRGLNQMFIQGDVLFLWFAKTRELLRFSLAGELLSRDSFAKALDQFAATTGSDGAIMRSIALSGGNALIAQVVVWNTQEEQAPATAHLVQVAMDGSSMTPLTLSVDKTQFLGRTSAGKLLVFEPNTRTIREF